MRREMSNGVTVLRVYCDLCTREGQPKRGRFGEVNVATIGKLQTSVLWYAQNPRGGNENKVGKWAGRILRDARVSEEQLIVDAFLQAYCRHHGWRLIAAADVLAALDGGHRDPVLTSWAVS